MQDKEPVFKKYMGNYSLFLHVQMYIYILCLPGIPPHPVFVLDL